MRTKLDKKEQEIFDRIKNFEDKEQAFEMMFDLGWTISREKFAVEQLEKLNKPL